MNIRDKLHFYEDKTLSITGSSGLLRSHLLDILGSLCKETRILVRKPIANNENRNKIIRGYSSSTQSFCCQEGEKMFKCYEEMKVIEVF